MQTLQRIFLPIFLAGGLFAQYPGLSLPPSGKNQKASVTQYIGPVTVTITYSSPAVHSPTGEDRRGKIWGKLVPYGMTDLGFGNAKMGPWRAGANENTVFAISNDVLIDGKPLPAGRYGVHMIPGENEWTIIFSKNAAAWGSFFYDPADDALRVTVKPHKNEYREWLAYDFVARRPDEATVELQWEELAVPWTVKVQDVYELNYARIRHELDSVPGFSPEGYDAAVNFCVQENIHLDQALKWADAAISMPFIGRTDFGTLSTKALVLTKMGNDAEADKVMEVAIHHPTATPIQIHVYGRQLLTAKKTKEAVKIFEYNAQRNGDAWPVHVGLARAYSATGDYPKALEHAKKALPQAPDPVNKKSLEGMIDTLSKGQPIG